MTFTIEIPLIGAMFLEVSGEWKPATPLENHEPCDAAEITHVGDMRIIARGQIGSLPSREYRNAELNVSTSMVMERDMELNERLIDALEDRGGY